VAVIHIQGGGADFNVIHTNDLWCVPERDHYPANFPMIREFLIKVRDLQVVQSDVIGPSELARLDLNPPGSSSNSATMVEFKNAQGKVLAAFLAGKRHLRPRDDSEPVGLHGLFDGRYILLPADPDNALLLSDDLAIVNPDPGSWLDQDFFKPENIKYVSLVSPDPGSSWEISRADTASPWILANPKAGEVLNAHVASVIGEILEFPSFDDVAARTSDRLADKGLDKPVVVTILTDYFAYTLKVGNREPNGDHPLAVSVQADIPATDPDAADLQAKLAREQALAPWVYDAGHWLERVLRDRSQLVGQTTITGGLAAQ
jgi:hypothetical protein